MFLRISGFDRQRFLPVLPVPVQEQDRDRRPYGFSVPHSGKEVRHVAFHSHATAAAVALLAPPEITVDKCLMNSNSGWQAREHGNQRLSVGLASG
jgi:hypothetical protein